MLAKLVSEGRNTRRRVFYLNRHPARTRPTFLRCRHGGCTFRVALHVGKIGTCETIAELVELSARS